jgi:uncharacterized membrane protein YphA (DoxX/SURF4 family)
MKSYAQLGIFGILALVALRVGIGWHFYMEGASKVRGHDFSSVGFLNAAKGPLAGKFQNLIWDHDGKIRLDQPRVEAMFSKAAQQAGEHFKFTEDQLKQAKQVESRYLEKLREVYASASDEIFKLQRSQDRLDSMNNDPKYSLASLRGQKEKIESELRSAVKPTLDTVDAIWGQYEARLNSIANPTQVKAKGYYTISKPGEGALSTRTVDKIIPIFDMSVGILLILGLLTPVASIAAALFLLSVVLSQMPGYPGTQPTYFQAVECLALLVLAGTDAGRYAGLDFIPWAYWNRRKATQPAAAVAARA